MLLLGLKLRTVLVFTRGCFCFITQHCNVVVQATARVSSVSLLQLCGKKITLPLHPGKLSSLCYFAYNVYASSLLLLHFPRGVEVLLLVAVGVSYRRLLLLQFSQELEALLTAAAVPASVKR